MSPEALALGLLSAVRATPLAIVYALLASDRPRRLLSGYVAAGLVVSLAAGLVIVTTFDGTARDPEARSGRYAIDAALGVAALLYAVLYATGRIGNRTPDSPPVPLEERLPWGIGRRLRHPTVPLAALAGAATNLPGLFYVAALVAVLETQPTPANGVFQVVVYNVLRFAVPLAGLVLVVLGPDRTRAVIDGVQDWARRRRRVLLIGVSVVVGVYLTVKGVLGLLG
ncbi:GAP family protein [Pseudonocardia endophytica]|uniref:Sap-like sulfolipid-1-addressing protein n=1 Tax=Pseudonocardia endophytica TaxID=401976 RepID=A0A4R1HRT4_PSEEN|nr:GAP family protein [Pseudonocardia endophytica]TCK24878.1 Sap-like sulfolipid-1-addressing protein [Pseudonocardia endophytica]